MIARLNIDVNTDDLADICRRYQVRELAIFGSALRDDFGEESDIDVLVEFQPGARVGLFRYFDLQSELERLFGRKVDLVSKKGLKPIIRDEVINTSEVLYAV